MVARTEAFFQEAVRVSDLRRLTDVHLSSFLQHVSKELDELNCSLSLIAQEELSKERKEELSRLALPRLRKLKAFVDSKNIHLHSLAEISRLMS